MYKKVKVVMLATQDTTAPIGIDDNSGKLFKFDCVRFLSSLWGYQHLYLLSDDEIKQDNCFLEDNRIRKSDNRANENWVLRKCTHLNNGWIFYDKEESVGCNPDWSKKIIASTDESLNVARLPNDFIEKYVNTYNANQPIESVDVEYNIVNINHGTNFAHKYVEALKSDHKDRVNIKLKKETWIREEVEKLCENAYDSGRYAVINKDIDQTFGLWKKRNL